MIDFNQELDWRKVCQAACAGWRWWIGELRAMLPPSLLARLSGDGGPVIVEIAASEVLIGRRQGRDHSETARLPREWLDKGFLPGEARTAWAGDRILVRLARDDVLRRRLHLPVAASRDLTQIIEHEVACHSPLILDLIGYDYRIRRRDRRADGLDVEILIVRRQTIDIARKTCQALGSEPAGFILADDAAVRPIFAKGRKSVFGFGSRAAVFAVTTILLLLLAFANLAASEMRDRNDLRRLTSLVAAQKAEAVQVEKLRQAIDSAKRHVDFLPQQRKKMVSRVLAEITRLLPDNSWLFELELNGAEIHLRGYSSEASALIPVFDASPLFENTRFRAPLTPGPRNDLERFDLSFTIRNP